MTARRAALKAAESLMGSDASAAVIEAEIRTVGFDYSYIAAGIAGEMRAAADRIRAIARKHMIEVGRELLSIKAMLPHGQFREWVAAEFDMTPRTAEYHMAAARLVDENEQCSHLPLPIVNAIARAPEHMQEGLIKRAASGDIISASSVREAVKAARADPDDDDERGRRCSQAGELFDMLGLHAARAVVQANSAVLAELRRIVAGHDDGDDNA